MFDMYLITAREGEFEVSHPTQGISGFRITPDHQGFMTLWTLLETMPGRVYTKFQPEGGGLPEGYDAQGFVEGAITLSQLGWRSSIGGSA